MTLSVNGIQGLWAEKDTKNTWEVNGIVAEKTHRPRGQKKSPIVLSDGPDGVMWGKGNLTGNLEEGMLVWRNRRGEATYRWEKASGKAETVPAARASAPEKAKPTAPIEILPPASRKNSVDKLTPRSSGSGSGMSNDTAEIYAGMGSSAMLASLPVDEQLDDKGDSDYVAVAEMKMLMEMASNRLMAGDVYMSMRYITLAQQVQPLAASFGNYTD
jgi:hypothetical protein